MSKKFINIVHLEGMLYQHKLELRTTGEKSKTPGTKFIMGTIEIVVDEAGINVIPVHFSYVTEMTAKGQPNSTYNILKNIIDGVHKSVMEHGKDKATKFRIDSAIALNEFYSDRNGETELISTKRAEGGFIHVVNNIDPNENRRNTFECDIVITGFKRMEETESRPEKGIVKGAIFDFRGALLPVEFSATAPAAMDYFEGLEPSTKNPIVTKIRGRMISETVVSRVTEESAFGEAEVRETRRTNKDYVITWAAPETMEWDSESTITAKELTDAMAARETYLATIKQRQDEYKASQGKASAASATGGFNF